MFLQDFPVAWKEFENLFERNRIFIDRTVNVGRISAEMAMAYGFTGRNLRAAGVDYDVRVAHPYSSYEDFDFIVPVGKSGDTYDRFCVRNAEIWESLSIIRQALDKMPEGNVFHADVPEYYFASKEDVYHDMESLIYHFKIVMGEIPVPVAEVYHAVEGGNGEVRILFGNRRKPNPIQITFPQTLLYILPSLSRNDKRSHALGCDCYFIEFKCYRRRIGRLKIKIAECRF